MKELGFKGVEHSQVLQGENDAKIKKWLLNNAPTQDTTRKHALMAKPMV